MARDDGSLLEIVSPTDQFGEIVAIAHLQIDEKKKKQTCCLCERRWKDTTRERETVGCSMQDERRGKGY